MKGNASPNAERSRRGLTWGRASWSRCVLLVFVGLVGCDDSDDDGLSASGAGAATINEVSANIVTPDAGAGGVIPDVDGRAMLDDEGRPVDWVEIYNSGPHPINLRDHSLTDDRDRPRRFRFPPGTLLAPGGYVIVICDGRPERGLFHASFRLRAGGETVFLFAENGDRLVDQRGYVDLDSGVTVGRYPDGAAGDYGVLYVPTPGKPNVPVDLKPPRFNATMSLTPLGDDFKVTIQVLEDREIEDAVLEVRDLGECGNERAASASVLYEEFEVEPLEDFVEQRTNFRGSKIDESVGRVALSFALRPDFDAGSLLELKLTATNVVGDAIRVERHIPGRQTPTLAINEYQPRNQNSLVFEEVRDFLGQNDGPADPDWLELYNYGTETIDLRDYALVGQGGFDNMTGGEPLPECPSSVDRPCREEDCVYTWRFGDLPEERRPVLGPGEFRLVLCDNDCPPFFKQYRVEEDVPPTFYSTDFQLSGDAPDLVALVDPCGVIIDLIEFDFSKEPGGIVTDTAVGRFPDAAGADPSVEPQCALSEFEDPPGDSRTFLTPGCRFDCGTPGGSNIADCDLAPFFGDVVQVNPRPPAANRSVEITTYVSIDSDTVAAETGDPLAVPPIDPSVDPLFDVEVEAEFVSLDGGSTTSLKLRRGDDALSVVRVTELDELICPLPRPVIAARTTYRVRAQLPGQVAGTLVKFSFGARDLRLAGLGEPAGDLVVYGEESGGAAAQNSFRYAHGLDRLPLRINEVLPDNETVFSDRGFYPDGVEFPAFLELYNRSSEPLEVGGMYISTTTHAPPCPPSTVESLKEYRIPDGTVIDPKGFLLFLFVEEGRNDEPNLPPDLAGRTVLLEIGDDDGLSDFRGTAFLTGPDELGNPIVDSLCWDTTAGGEGDRCEEIAADVAVGWLPEADPALPAPISPPSRHRPEIESLRTPTPWESNCAYEPLQILESVTHSVVSADPNACPKTADIVQIVWFAVVNMGEWLAHSDVDGIESAELIIERDGVADTLPVPSPTLPEAGPSRCERLLRFNVLVPPPQAQVVRYTIRLRDTRGTVAEAGPFEYRSSLSVTINEVQATNTETALPGRPDGSFAPWFELHNGTGGSFDFGGMFVSDDIAAPRKWQIPEVEAVVPTGGFLLITTGPVPVDGGIHSTLGILTSAAAELFLFESDLRGNCRVDRMPFNFTGLGADATIGRLPDGAPGSGVLDCPTPGQSNRECDGADADFIRGDANSDGAVNVPDMARIFQDIFSGAIVTCEDAHDVNDDGVRSEDDATYLGDFFFFDGPTVPEPFPEPGPDPTPDALGCSP